MPHATEIFDVFAFALRSSATLGDRYRRTSRYFRLVHEGVHVTVEEAAFATEAENCCVPPCPSWTT